MKYFKTKKDGFVEWIAMGVIAFFAVIGAGLVGASGPITCAIQGGCW